MQEEGIRVNDIIFYKWNFLETNKIFRLKIKYRRKKPKYILKIIANEKRFVKFPNLQLRGHSLQNTSIECQREKLWMLLLDLNKFQ